MKRPIASFSTASNWGWSNSSLEIGGWLGRSRLEPGPALAAAPWRRGGGVEVEDRPLPHERVLLRLLPRRLRGFEHFEHPLAGRAGGAERAALDERLDRLLVDSTGIHALAEVP